MVELFSDSIGSDNDEYLALRDDPRFSEIKHYCNELWRKFYPFADRLFVDEFSRNLHQRFWEMYLGVQLLELGFDLQPRSSDEGPDLLINDGNRKVWIEATVPSEGVGIDRVPNLEEHTGFVPVPDDRIILRFTNSISEKNNKLDNYLREGIVFPEDAYLIAVCGGIIQLMWFDGPMPNIVRALYPVGDHKVTLDFENKEIIDEHFESRYEILKDSGSPVRTDSFLDPTYSRISGVLFSNVAITDIPIEPGREFLFIHNYHADLPIERGWIRTGKDYWFQDNRIHSTQNK
jgi:hypothetical protein